MPVRDHLPIPSARFVRMRQTNSRYLQMYAPLMCTLFRKSEHLRIAASLCVAHIVLYISPRPHQCEVSSKKKQEDPKLPAQANMPIRSVPRKVYHPNVYHSYCRSVATSDYIRSKLCSASSSANSRFISTHAGRSAHTPFIFHNNRNGQKAKTQELINRQTMPVKQTMRENRYREVDLKTKRCLFKRRWASLEAGQRKASVLRETLRNSKKEPREKLKKLPSEQR